MHTGELVYYSSCGMYVALIHYLQRAALCIYEPSLPSKQLRAPLSFCSLSYAFLAVTGCTKTANGPLHSDPIKFVSLHNLISKSAQGNQDNVNLV